MLLAISPITKNELNTVMLNWAEKEGWHYSQQDVDAYFAINGNNIFALKKLDADNSVQNELVGCVSITNYTNSQQTKKNYSLKSIGLYIIKKEYRGQQKYGPALWEKVMKELLDCDIACLNSVPRVSAYYARSGFFKTGKLSSHYHLDIPTIELPNLNNDSSQKLLDKIYQSQLNDTLKEQIATYEANLFGMTFPERDKFRDIWFSRQDAIVIAYINDNKAIEGYGVLTMCSSDQNNISYRLSPFYSNSIDITAQLLEAFLYRAYKQSAASIDLNIIITTHTANSQILSNYGFIEQPDGSTELMIKSQQPQQNIEAPYQVVALSPLEFPHEICLTSKSLRL